MTAGPEVLHSKLASGNPGTLTQVGESVTTSMTSLESNADSLALATTGVEWQGQDRESFNQLIWATKAMAEMAHMRCSQGKVALRSVRQSYLAAQQYADLVITTWRTNKVLNLTPADLITCRDDAIAKLTLAHTYYSERLVWATDYLPTDELAQQNGDKDDWKKYLDTGGLSDSQLAALKRGMGHSMTWGLDRGLLPGPVIPDTEITGNDDGYTSQGLGYSPENGGTMVQVSYGGEGDNKALASLIDPDTGELLNSVNLGGWSEQVGDKVIHHDPHHVGSVIVDGNNVWVTSGSPSRAIRYSLDDIRNAQVGTTVESRGSASLESGGHSFSTIHTDPGGTTYLYAGKFGDDRMYRYEKVGNDWVQDDDYEVKTPEFTQGVVVTDGEISFSTSYGREYESEVKTFDRGTLEDGKDASDNHGLLSNIHVPNMSEGMTQTPEGLALVHESGADQYAGTNDNDWVSPFMSILPNEQAGVSGGGIEVEPQTLREAAGKLTKVEASLTTASRAIYAIHLPAASLGEVEGAADFAKALNLHLDATAIWLERSEISAGISIDGLRGSADEHERIDTTTRSWLEWDREHGDLIGKGQDAYEKADDATPWDGVFNRLRNPSLPSILGH